MGQAALILVHFSQQVVTISHVSALTNQRELGVTKRYLVDTVLHSCACQMFSVISSALTDNVSCFMSPVIYSFTELSGNVTLAFGGHVISIHKSSTCPGFS